MDIIQQDTSELEAFIAQHCGDGAYLRHCPDSVREAISDFERTFNSETTLFDVKNLDRKCRDSIPAEFRELFLMKILYYVVTITNRILPEDAYESRLLLEKLKHPEEEDEEENGWAEGAKTALQRAFIFLDNMEADPEPGSAFQRLYDHYYGTFREMCKEADIFIITKAELEQLHQKSEERKKERKKKWIIAGIIFIIGFHLVKYIIGLF